MATLHISYYGAIEQGCAKDPCGYEALITSGASVQSAAVPGFATVAKIQSDVAHWFKDGADPTITETNGSYLEGGEVAWLRCNRNYKIAAMTVE